MIVFSADKLTANCHCSILIEASNVAGLATSETTLSKLMFTLCYNVTCKSHAWVYIVLTATQVHVCMTNGDTL